MACAVAAPLLEPSGDFPAWLEAQGVNAEVARAMDSELGIRDYGVLRACVGDGLVRAELLATARDRLPFGFYAVLRQVVKALQGADTHDGGTTPGWDADAVTAPSDVTLGGLVDVLLALFSGLSRELLMSARRLGAIDEQEIAAVALSPPGAEIEHEDLIAVEERLATEDDPPVEYIDEHQDPDQEAPCDSREPRDEGGGSSAAQPNLGTIQTWHGVKMEICDATDIAWSVPGDDGSHRGAAWDEVTLGETALISPVVRAGNCVGKGHLGIIIQDVTSLFASGKALVHGERRRVDGDAEEDSRRPPWLQHKASGEAPGERAVSELSAQPLAESNHNQAPSAAGSGRLPESVQHGGRFRPSAEQQRQERLAATGVGAALTCDVCGQAFAQRRVLDVHRLTHTGEKPHHCGVCGRAFSQSCSLKRHQRTHTGERPHRCAVCARAFALRGDLKNHQRIHTGEKPYRCAVCDRAFAWYSSLKTHQNTHTREWPLRCKVCGLAFGQQAMFRRHQRVHAHGEEALPEAAVPPPATGP